MEDVDGDDKFDRKTPVLDNTFGSFDTHAVMNNFKYGIDNHIWSAVGYSGMYNPGEAPPPGERTNQDERILPMGVFRFSRDGSYLDEKGIDQFREWRPDFKNAAFIPNDQGQLVTWRGSEVKVKDGLLVNQDHRWRASRD